MSDYFFPLQWLLLDGWRLAYDSSEYTLKIILDGWRLAEESSEYTLKIIAISEENNQ